MRYVSIIWLLLCFSFARAQEIESVYDFSLLRQNDDIKIIQKDSKTFYEDLKSLKLGKNITLGFGGSYRFQTETFINEQFSNEEDQNDIWFLNRLQLHSHFKIDNKFELFAELNSSLIYSKEELAPVDRDELSFNQLFARYYFNKNLNLLVGRQNMRLGSGRLIDVREGPNVRLSFDMLQVEYKNENTNIKVFYAVPLQLEEGIFDNDALNVEQESLVALYWSQNWTKETGTDFYVLYKEEKNKTWNSGTADDNRMSIGLRHYGNWKNFTYNNEFVYQIGRFGDQNIRAWTASFNIEHPFSLLGENGIVGLKTEAISGDTNNADNGLNTFDGLYPRGAYFGRVARFGPSNLIDFHPYINTQFGDFSLSLDYVAFWRFSKQDGVYSPPLILEYPSINEERFIGHQIGTITGFEVNEFFALEFESNVIFPDGFLEESDLNDTLFHAVITAEFKF
ncbi:alginate export family protein [uncultured Aquimarina sp.]|uniref:alginate export family protein n=1 Tax=uncultured Aquimarina sp. TaxID=575652 RepID=UPI0026174A10|nr:alginate export family protein [uncultured Aquimarina sp.]